MKNCHLEKCEKQASKEFTLNAESYTRWEFHIVGPYYRFCSQSHLDKWKDINKEFHISG